jgi:hypothetical protein
MPDEVSHGWIEVNIEGNWRRIDSYINDFAFYQAGKKKLQEKNWDTGYSISCSIGESDPEFNIDNEKFVQMDAVTEDHGTWDEPMDYYNSDSYKNRPSKLKLFFYSLLIGRINRRVKKLRENKSN